MRPDLLESFSNPYPFRDYEIYMECDEFTSQWMEVVGTFNVRGGIKSIVTARHGDRAES